MRENGFKVFQVHKIEDVQEIEHIHQIRSIKHFCLKFAAKILLSSANLFLKILRIILFGFNSYNTGKIKSLIVHIEGAIGDIITQCVFLDHIKGLKEKPDITILYNGGSQKIANLTREIIESLLRIGSFNFIHMNKPLKEIFNRNSEVRKLKYRNYDLYACLTNFWNWGGIATSAKEILFAKLVGCRDIIGFELKALYLKGLFLPVINDFMKNYPRRSKEIAKIVFSTYASYSVPNANNSQHLKIYSYLKRKGVDLGKPLIIISPGAQYSWKRWPITRFAALARWISENYNAQILVTGTKEEIEISEVVARSAGKAGFNLAGQTNILKLIQLLKISRVCITNDTGTMHIAAYVRTPIVAFFTSSESPRVFFPLSRNKVEVLFSLPYCAYCHRRGKYWSNCSIPTKCIKAIGINNAKNAFIRIWNNNY
jgi:ADP-heptose:LPS heptosyltransferase